MAKFERAIIGTLATAACVMIFPQARQLSHLRAQIQLLQQQHRSAVERIQQLQQEREATRLQSALRCDDTGQSGSDKTELLRLRGEVAVLRAQLNESFQDEFRRSAEPSVPAQTIELGAGPKLLVNFAPALWKPAWSLSNPDPAALQSLTWDLDTSGSGWLQITLGSHSEHIEEAQFKERLLAQQTLRGDPAEFVGESHLPLAGREWTVLEFHNGNTQPPRAELHYFLPADGGYVEAFVAGEEASMPGHRVNIEAFLRQIRLQ